MNHRHHWCNADTARQQQMTLHSVHDGKIVPRGANRQHTAGTNLFKHSLRATASSFLPLHGKSIAHAVGWISAERILPDSATFAGQMKINVTSGIPCGKWPAIRINHLEAPEIIAIGRKKTHTHQKRFWNYIDHITHHFLRDSAT